MTEEPNKIEFSMLYDRRKTTTSFPPDINIYEMYEYFEEFLLAVGFSPESIENGASCSKCNNEKKQK